MDIHRMRIRTSLTEIGLIVAPGERKFVALPISFYFVLFISTLTLNLSTSLSPQITLVLLSHKIAYPKSVHLLRGNHESMMCTKEYGFRNEVEDKYNAAVYQNFLYIFNSLPICGIINKRIFIVVCLSPLTLSFIHSLYSSLSLYTSYLLI